LPHLAAHLSTLKLNLSFSELDDDGGETIYTKIIINFNCLNKTARILAYAVQSLSNLRVLHVDFRSDSVREDGAKAWGEALEKLKKVHTLHLNFSGYSQARNNVNKKNSL
jgi:hypothetical protein